MGTEIALLAFDPKLDLGPVMSFDWGLIDS